MDDKEKEKFGVIIDKNDQDTENQSKVDESTEDKNIYKESVTTSSEGSTNLEEKQPESDKTADVLEKNDEETNLEESVKDNQQNPQNESLIKNENVEEKKEHQVIHKKDGRLHIYIRQDKYKGELKSKNWVGRLYIDGKQKISSSGTPNIDEAIPILEKWFDDIHAESEKQKKLAEESKAELENSGKFDKPIVTAITDAPAFYIAEEYHQDFYKKQSMRYQMYAEASGRKGYLKETWDED